MAELLFLASAGLHLASFVPCPTMPLLSINVAAVQKNAILFKTVTKALPILSLIAVNRGRCGVTKLNIALALSAVGDVFLAQPSDDFFIFGLGSFLVSHLFYTSAFWDDCKHEKFSIARVMPFIAAGSFLLKILIPKVPSDLTIPVIVYALVILSMGITASQGKLNFGRILGAVIFAVSDSTLAINKFVQPIECGQMVVMITYYLAQILLVKNGPKSILKKLF